MRSLGLVTVGATLLVAALGTRTAVPAELAELVSDVRISADPHNALRGTLTVTTREPTRIALDIASAGHAFVVRERTPPSTEHEIPLLQLLADTTYDLEVTVADVGGAPLATGPIGSFSTGRLPDDLPPVTLDTSEPGRMTPGLTLFNSVYRDPPQGPENPDRGFLTAVDERGRIVWYHRDRISVGDSRRLENGDLLHASGETGARRVTPTGNVVAEWRGTARSTDPTGIGDGVPAGRLHRLEVHSIHHEVTPTPDGDAMVGLSRLLETIRMDDPCDESDEAVDTNVVGDGIVVFDPETGEVLAEHSLFDQVDPAEDADDDWCTSFLDQAFEVGETRDWSHGNAVIPIDGGRTWLASYRHLDELIAFRAQDEPEGPAGSIRWRMGPTDTSDFELEGDGLWFWHQHAPELEPDGTLMVYDNGNGRTDADAQFSRAVRYEVDTDSMTVRQIWEHVMPNRLFASFLGDADLLDGTVLITHGGQIAPCELKGEDDDSFFFGQIVEVDEASGDIVWQITTRDDDRCAGWGIYRADRIPTIYPPEFDVTNR